MRSCIEDQDPGKRPLGAGAAGLRALPAPDLRQKNRAARRRDVATVGIPVDPMWLAPRSNARIQTGKAQDELRKCGNHSADKSWINRRLKAHPVPVLPINEGQTCDKGHGAENFIHHS
ncbi:hypothetical protein FJW05_17570 [Mesorhizobium sp. B2-9-1]|nr:hypothetical protein FJW05_17570 [Mesorhizobium sp. B2-9-1]